MRGVVSPPPPRPLASQPSLTSQLFICEVEALRCAGSTGWLRWFIPKIFLWSFFVPLYLKVCWFQHPFLHWRPKSISSVLISAGVHYFCNVRQQCWNNIVLDDYDCVQHYWETFDHTAGDCWMTSWHQCCFLHWSTLLVYVSSSTYASSVDQHTSKNKCLRASRRFQMEPPHLLWILPPHPLWILLPAATCGAMSSPRPGPSRPAPPSPRQMLSVSK